MGKNTERETYFSFSMTPEFNKRFEQACEEMGTNKRSFVLAALEEKLNCADRVDSVMNDDIPMIKRRIMKLEKENRDFEHMVMTLVRRVMDVEFKLNNSTPENKDKQNMSDEDVWNLFNDDHQKWN